jgi:tRNA A-37 threonylcarbamoyl transferase component Bud32
MIEKKSDNFAVVKRGGWTLYLNRGYSAALLDAGIADPELLVKNGISVADSGRSKAVLFGFSEGKGVLRELRHGGMFRALTGGLFLSKKRPLCELDVHEYAGKCGVNVPEPLAACVRRAGLGFRAYIATRFIENAVELAACFTREADMRLSEKKSVVAACGREVRRMHDAGILHADLHVRNILVRRGKKPEAFIVDFDKAVLKKAVVSGDREKNLLRLGRSVDKLPADERPNAADMLRFLVAYLDAGEPLDFDMRKFARKFSAHRRLHAASRKLPGQKERL